MRPASGRRLGPAALALGALALLGAACGSGAASTSSSPSSTTTTTTTTTTTLPQPVKVDGTGTAGPLGSLGLVERVPVVPVPDGAVTPPPDPPASAAAAHALQVGFHQLGAGPDLLLIMGQHGTMTWWDPALLNDLAQHYRVTIFDLPGIGYSAPDPAATSVEALADVTAGLSGALGLVHPVLLGWGLGGEVALALAERHPGLASKLVLVDTSAGGPAATPPAPAVSQLMAAPDATMIELSRLCYPPSAEAERRAFIGRIAELAPDDIVASALASQAALQSAFSADKSVAEELPTISVPALVVVGEQDEIFPEANATALVAGLRTVHVLLLPDAGYASLFQDEPRFVSAVESFTG
ncbi:MAG TPA: alpha/beta hydrolase [Acidimicrobiales bacterium]|nr:alpha/beta hydrolase [Acidimicrobiales bacterium]